MCGPTHFGKALNLIFPKLSSQSMCDFDHAMILSPSFHSLRKERLEQWPLICVLNMTKKPGGGIPEKLGGDVQHTSWNPYRISVQNLWFSLPYFSPGAQRVTRVRDKLLQHVAVVGVNIKRETLLSPNDKEVANSSKKHTQFKTRVHKLYPISDQNGWNWYPISDWNGKNHTLWRHIYLYSLYKGVLPPPPGRRLRCRLWVALFMQARLIRVRRQRKLRRILG